MNEQDAANKLLDAAKQLTEEETHNPICPVCSEHGDTATPAEHEVLGGEIVSLLQCSQCDTRYDASGRVYELSADDAMRLRILGRDPFAGHATSELPADMLIPDDPVEIHVPDDAVLVGTESDNESDLTSFADRLREETVATALKISRFGTSRKLEPHQLAQMAETFHADSRAVRGGKQLLDTSHPKYRAVTRILNEASKDWRDSTRPHPEHGIRLLKINLDDDGATVQSNVAAFQGRIDDYQTRLADAVRELNELYRTELIPAAQGRLADLFNAADYPVDLSDAWSIDIEYPQVGPDDRLKTINPDLYERERRRAEQRFEEAVRLTEEAMADELRKVISTLVDRLEPQDVNVYQYRGDNRIDLLHEQALLFCDSELLKIAMQEYDDNFDGSPEEFHNQPEEELADVEARIAQIDEQLQLSRAESIERRDNKITIEFPKPDKGKAEKTITKTFTDATDEPGSGIVEATKWLEDRGCEWLRVRQETKTFRAASVANLQTFFDRFRELNIGSNQDLDRLVEDAKAATAGISIKGLRDANVEARQTIREPIAAIAERLDSLMIDKPVRTITFDE